MNPIEVNLRDALADLLKSGLNDKTKGQLYNRATKKYNLIQRYGLGRNNSLLNDLNNEIRNLKGRIDLDLNCYENED